VSLSFLRVFTINLYSVLCDKAANCIFNSWAGYLSAKWPLPGLPRTTLVRDYCTDNTWSSPNCRAYLVLMNLKQTLIAFTVRNICTSLKGGRDGDYSYVKNCVADSTENIFCCSGGDPTLDCCTGLNTFSLGNLTIFSASSSTSSARSNSAPSATLDLVVTATATATVTVTPAPKSKVVDQNVAIGLGVVLGLLAVLGALGGFVAGAKRQRKTEIHDSPLPPFEHPGYNVEGKPPVEEYHGEPQEVSSEQVIAELGPTDMTRK
jgi:hypothetical protein